MITVHTEDPSQQQDASQQANTCPLVRPAAHRARGKGYIARVSRGWSATPGTRIQSDVHVSRLRGFRRSRDTLAPSWHAGGSSWKTNYMVLMNLAGPEAGRNFTTTTAVDSFTVSADPTGLLSRTLAMSWASSPLHHRA
jgi:hypothetical protein